MLMPRRMLGPYRLTEIISRAASMALYKGYHAAQERWVAVKVVRLKNQPSARQIACFEQTMQQVACLRHPNILSLLDYGHQTALVYQVSDYVPTGTLKRRLAFGLELCAALDMTLHLADALSHAHGEGVAHGGLSLSSIVLASGDWPLLTDFGLTTLLHANGALPAPLADSSADIYALGAILFEVLARTTLSDTPGELADQPPSAPGIPQEIETVIWKASAFNPARRYRRMKDMIDDLQTARALLFGQEAALEWPLDGWGGGSPGSAPAETTAWPGRDAPPGWIGRLRTWLSPL